MTYRILLLGAAAALALTACGDKTDKDSSAPTAGSQSTQAALSGDKSPIDKPFKLAGAKAADVDALFAMLPAGNRPTYDKAEFNQALGATVISNLRIGDPGEGVTVERAELYGVDHDAIQTLIEKGKTLDTVAPDSDFAQVFRKVRMFNVSIDTPDDVDADFSMKAMELDNLRMKPLPGGEGFDHDKEAAAGFDSFDLGGIYVEGLSFDVDDDASSAKFAVDAPDLRIVGLGRGRIGGISMTDLTYSADQSAEEARQSLSALAPQMGELLNSPLGGLLFPGQVKATIGSMVWKDIDFSGLLKAGLAGEKPAYDATDLINLGTVDMKDMKTFVHDRLAAQTEEARIDAFEFTWLLPSKVRMSSKSSMIDYTAYVDPSDTKTTALLTDAGLAHLQGTSDLKWDWDAKSGDAGFVSTSDLKDFVHADLSFDLADMVMSEIGAKLDAGDEGAFADVAAFKALQLKIVDKKALDAVFKVAAAQMNAEAADLRQSAPAMVRMYGAQAAQVSPALKDYVDAFADFVAEGGSLTVVAQPAQPMTFTDIEKASETAPQQLPETLGVSVTHSK